MPKHIREMLIKVMLTSFVVVVSFWLISFLIGKARDK